MSVFSNMFEGNDMNVCNRLVEEFQQPIAGVEAEEEIYESPEEPLATYNSFDAGKSIATTDYSQPAQHRPNTEVPQYTLHQGEGESLVVKSMDGEELGVVTPSAGGGVSIALNNGSGSNMPTTDISEYDAIIKSAAQTLDGNVGLEEEEEINPEEPQSPEDTLFESNNRSWKQNLFEGSDMSLNIWGDLMNE